MRDLQGLSISDFKKRGNVILGKVEVDKSGGGQFKELSEILDFRINSNITNIFLKTCSNTFDITLLNTNDRYSLIDKGKSDYNHIKQGRRCKLYIGVEKESKYYWSWLYGIIDNVTTSKDSQSEICNISGRDYIAYLSESYIKKNWWGDNKQYAITPNKEFYQMEEDCKGIYRAFVKIEDEPYREIWLNNEYTYDWDINQLVFLKPNIPDVSGELWVYYLTSQKIEEVVADLLIEAGLLSTSQKIVWINNTNYCKKTDIEIDRVYFDSGISYLNAIEMLTQIAPYYRLYVNEEGMPCFKPPPLLDKGILVFRGNEYMVKNVEERIDELYNHFIFIGEKREMRRNWVSVMAYPEIKDLTPTSATLQGALTSKAKDTNIIRRGFVWQREGQAEEQWIEWGNFELGYYSHTITVEPNSNYSFKAYAKDNQGVTKYSTIQYFKTPESDLP